jgi:hypothetical protein
VSNSPRPAFLGLISGAAPFLTKDAIPTRKAASLKSYSSPNAYSLSAQSRRAWRFFLGAFSNSRTAAFP